MRRKDREVTELSEIEEILQSCKTCHVAMMDEGRPYVVPLSFGYEMKDGTLTLYFHCAVEGKKLELLKRNNRVCFEMCCEGEPLFSETPCNSGYYFSSVIGYGEAEFLEDEREKCKALNRMYFHQSGLEEVFTPKQAAGVCVFQIKSTEFTGKKKEKPSR